MNLNRVAELSAQGAMHAAGLKAFEAREEARSRIYAFEQGTVELSEAMKEEFQANASAWTFFQSQPAGYRKIATWWVISAKQEPTRQRRLRLLMQYSEQGERIPQLRPTPKQKSA